MIAFERRHARKDSVIDSRVSNLQQRVHRTLEIVIRRGRRLRDFSWLERGYELLGKRVNVNLNVILRKPKRLESLSLVDEAIGESLR